MCLKFGSLKKCGALLISAFQFAQGLATFIYATSGAIKPTNQTSLFIAIAAAAMNMWVGLVLCIGVNSSRPSLLRIWLAWAAVIVMLFVIAVPVTILLSIFGPSKNVNLTATLAKYSLLFLLHCFFIHIVYGYYEEVMKREIEIIEDNLEQHYHQQPQHQFPGHPPVNSFHTNRIDTYQINNERQTIS